MSGKIKSFDGGLTPHLGEPVSVGIDQSYSGFAIAMVSGDKYQASVYKSDKLGTDRLKDIQQYLKSALSPYLIGDVAMEGYAYGAQMAHMAGELGGMVKVVLLDKGHYPLIVAPSMLKKYVTGKGTGVQKNQMLLNIYKTWNIEFTDDNAADAFALAKLVSKEAKYAYQKEILDKLNDDKYRNV
jgi:Holliday junction resolvasome RuvABC endonuclease subunit